MRRRSLVLRRLLHAVPMVLAGMCLNFLLLRLIPGDPVDVLLNGAEGASQAYVDHLRAAFGLDQPLHMQLLHYLAGLARLDLGYSLMYSQPVLDLILASLFPTVLLMTVAITVAFLTGLALGAISARKVHGLRDNTISILVLLGFATPSFWLGLMLIVLFSVKLGWFPVGGFMTIGAGPGLVAQAVDVAHHLVLPAGALALFYVAIYARVMRASTLEVISLDFVRTARAKGLSERRVMFRHVVRNALLPVVTLLSMQLGSLLGGAIVIETVFSWPGLGRLAQEAVMQRDYNLLLGILLVSSVLVIVLNLVVDAFYSRLDPRLEAA